MSAICTVERNVYLHKDTTTVDGKFYRVDAIKAENGNGSVWYWLVKNWGADSYRGRDNTSKRGQYSEPERFGSLGSLRTAYNKAVSRKTIEGYAVVGNEDDLPLTHEVAKRVRDAAGNQQANQPAPSLTPQAPQKAFPATDVLNLTPIAALGVRAMQEASAGRLEKALELREQMVTLVGEARAELMQGEAMLDTLVGHLQKLL